MRPLFGLQGGEVRSSPTASGPSLIWGTAVFAWFSRRLRNVCAVRQSVFPEQTQPEIELVEADHDSYYVSAGLTWHKVGTRELINWELVALVAAEGHRSGISVQQKGD